MVFTVNLFSRGQTLFKMFFSLVVLTERNVYIPEVVVALRYVTMVFTVDLSSDG